MKQEVSLRDRIDKAFELLREKENAKAIELVRGLLKIDPEIDQGWLLLGIANRRIGDLDSAITCLQKTTEVNNSMEEAWGLLAVTYLDRKQEKRAKECLLRSVELNPSSEELKFYEQNLIRIYKMFGPFF